MMLSVCYPVITEIANEHQKDGRMGKERILKITIGKDVEKSRTSCTVAWNIAICTGYDGKNIAVP